MFSEKLIIFNFGFSIKETGRFMLQNQFCGNFYSTKHFLRLNDEKDTVVNRTLTRLN